MIFKLVFRYALQGPSRALMCALSVAMIAGALQLADHLRRSWTVSSDVVSAKRLVTRNLISITQTLPLTYADTIRSIPGVKALTYNSWLGGYFREPSNTLDSYAIPDEGFFSIYPEYVVAPDVMARFLEDRTGCLISEAFARKHGLRVGDTLSIEDAIYPGPWQFRVSGTYAAADEAGTVRQIFLRWVYFDERLSQLLPHIAHNLDNFTVELRDPSALGSVAKRIDQAFENASRQTYSESEEAFSAGFVAMLDSKIAVLNVLTVVGVVACVLILGSVAAISVLTRRHELNHLRVIGFPERFVAAVIILEPVLVAFLGAYIGLALARLAAPYLNGVQGLSLAASIAVSLSAVLRTSIVALCVGVLAGCIGCAVVLHKRPADILALPA